MKLLSMVVCCGSCDGTVVEEGRSLAAQPPARRRWRRVAVSGGENVNNVTDWKPSLSAISEDDFPVTDQRKQPQKKVYPKESQMIKRKIESSPKPRTRQYDHHYHEHVRPSSFSTMLFPALVPSPFMF